MSTDTALFTATKAAYQALQAARARGDFGNTSLYHAIATSGISFEDACLVTEEAIRLAVEMRGERDTITHEEHAQGLQDAALAKRNMETI